MQLLSVNIGHVQSIKNGKESGKTGIFKIPTTMPVRITHTGLEGDAIVDSENHGGVDQAVYVFGGADYEWWSKTLERALTPGTFGENLTIGELETAPLSIGDRLRVGAVVLEVTGARIPCVTLAARMGDPGFVKRFRDAERPGVYCRVIEPGVVRMGDPVALEPYRGETVTVLYGFRLYYENKGATEAVLRGMLAAPIDIRSRRYYEHQLAALLAKAVE